MDTELLSPNQMERAAELMRASQLVSFPTETVYGLGARIYDPEAIKRVFEAKQRPIDNPLIAHVSTLAQVEDIACDIPPLFFLLAEAFFPGPLTVVLKKHSRIPSIVSAGLETIALRMPSHPIALQLIALVGEPIVAPSANLSGKPSSTQAQHVLDDFSGKIAAVIDGGSTEFGIESTVISLVHQTPLLLRLGKITKQEIEAVLGHPIKVATSSDDAAKCSPGMKYRHYAPKAPLTLFTCPQKMNAYTQSSLHKCIILTPTEKNLYALLRQSDAEGFEEIVILCTDQMSSALLNRLERASYSL